MGSIGVGILVGLAALLPPAEPVGQAVTSRPARERRAPAGPYLGQEPPGHEPRIFAPGLISRDGMRSRESNISFWPGGRRCVFHRAGPGIPPFTVFETRIENGAWLEPRPSPLFGGLDAFQPGLAPDGHRLLFTTTRLTPPPGAGDDWAHLWETVFAEGRWSPPAYIGPGLYPSVTEDGTIYFTTRMAKTWHIARRRHRAGRYEALEVVGPRVLSRHADAHPCIAPDESYLIFDSDRPRKGPCALFVSFRRQNGLWTEPRNLGRWIRRRASLARVSPDGRYLFFQSDGDLYWMDTGFLAELATEELRRR